MPHLPHVRVTREPIEEDAPTGANLMGIGLVIAGAIACALLLLVGALALAAYVVIHTI